MFRSFFLSRRWLPWSVLGSFIILFGTWFRLKPEAFEDLPQFGFADQERPIVDHLLNGASLADLEAIVGIDVRQVRAALYALCAANACNVGSAPPAATHWATNADTSAAMPKTSAAMKTPIFRFRRYLEANTASTTLARPPAHEATSNHPPSMCTPGGGHASAMKAR